MVALWATKTQFNSFGSGLSNGHLEMAQKGPGRLDAQQAHLNSLL
jgi:hypothetical protein